MTNMNTKLMTKLETRPEKLFGRFNKRLALGLLQRLADATPASDPAFEGEKSTVLQGISRLACAQISLQ